MLQKSHLMRLIINLSLCHLRARLTETRNQKSRPLSNLFLYYESNDSLIFAKWATFEMRIFQGNHRYTIFCVISVFMLLEIYFENQTYP